MSTVRREEITLALLGGMRWNRRLYKVLLEHLTICSTPEQQDSLRSEYTDYVRGADQTAWSLQETSIDLLEDFTELVEKTFSVNQRLLQRIYGCEGQLLMRETMGHYVPICNSPQLYLDYPEILPEGRLDFLSVTVLCELIRKHYDLSHDGRYRQIRKAFNFGAWLRQPTQTRESIPVANLKAWFPPVQKAHVAIQKPDEPDNRFAEVLGTLEDYIDSVNGWPKPGVQETEANATDIVNQEVHINKDLTEDTKESVPDVSVTNNQTLAPTADIVLASREATVVEEPLVVISISDDVLRRDENNNQALKTDLDTQKANKAVVKEQLSEQSTRNLASEIVEKEPLGALKAKTVVDVHQLSDAERRKHIKEVAAELKKTMPAAKLASVAKKGDKTASVVVAKPAAKATDTDVKPQNLNVHLSLAAGDQPSTMVTRKPRVQYSTKVDKSNPEVQEMVARRREILRQLALKKARVTSALNDQYKTEAKKEAASYFKPEGKRKREPSPVPEPLEKPKKRVRFAPLPDDVIVGKVPQIVKKLENRRRPTILMRIYKDETGEWTTECTLWYIKSDFSVQKLKQGDIHNGVIFVEDNYYNL